MGIIGSAFLGFNRVLGAGDNRPGYDFPTVIKDFTFFYSAYASEPFLDWSYNNNTGTQNGSIGYTGVVGGSSYWTFDANAYVETGVTPPTGNYTFFTIQRSIADPVSPVVLNAYDGANDQIRFLDDRTPSVEVDAKTLTATTTFPTSQDYMLMVVSDNVGGTLTLYVNNVSEATSTSEDLNITDTITLGTPTTDQFGLSAAGMLPRAITTSERNELYNYFNNIYSF